MKLSYIIQNGESRTVEFKREIPRSGTLAKTILSFTNGAGGYTGTEVVCPKGTPMAQFNHFVLTVIPILLFSN